MSADFFFWYILPLVIAAAAWLAVLLYERIFPDDRLHPGE